MDVSYPFPSANMVKTTCLCIRIGIYKIRCIPPSTLSLVIDDRGLSFQIPKVNEGGSSLVWIHLKREGIVQILGNFDSTNAVLFMHNTLENAEQIWFELGVISGQKTYYDPESTDETLRNIIFSLDCSNKKSIDSLREYLLKSTFFTEINHEMAHDVLKVSLPPKEFEKVLKEKNSSPLLEESYISKSSNAGNTVKKIVVHSSIDNSTSLFCELIKIGSYETLNANVMYDLSVLMSPTYISFKLPGLNEKKVKNHAAVTLFQSDLVKVVGCVSEGNLLYLFVQTTVRCAKEIRTDLGLEIDQFNPSSPDETIQLIIFMFSTTHSENFIKNIADKLQNEFVSRGKCILIDSNVANQLLKRTGSQHCLTTKESSHSLKKKIPKSQAGESVLKKPLARTVLPPTPSLPCVSNVRSIAAPKIVRPNSGPLSKVIIQRITKNDSILNPTVVKQPVIKEVDFLGPTNVALKELSKIMALYCRAIRIGSFEIYPGSETSFLFVCVSLDSFFFQVPKMKHGNGLACITLKDVDILKVSCYFTSHPRYPFIHIHTTFGCAKRIKSQLCMTKSEGEMYHTYSKVEYERGITLMLDKFESIDHYERVTDFFHNVFPNTKTIHISRHVAETLLQNYTPKKVCIFMIDYKLQLKDGEDKNQSELKTQTSIPGKKDTLHSEDILKPASEKRCFDTINLEKLVSDCIEFIIQEVENMEAVIEKRTTESTNKYPMTSPNDVSVPICDEKTVASDEMEYIISEILSKSIHDAKKDFHEVESAAHNDKAVIKNVIEHLITQVSFEHVDNIKTVVSNIIDHLIKEVSLKAVNNITFFPDEIISTVHEITDVISTVEQIIEEVTYRIDSDSKKKTSEKHKQNSNVEQIVFDPIVSPLIVKVENNTYIADNDKITAVRNTRCDLVSEEMENRMSLKDIEKNCNKEIEIINDEVENYNGRLLKEKKTNKQQEKSAFQSSVVYRKIAPKVGDSPMSQRLFSSVSKFLEKNGSSAVLLKQHSTFQSALDLSKFQKLSFLFCRCVTIGSYQVHPFNNESYVSVCITPKSFSFEVPSVPEAAEKKMVMVTLKTPNIIELFGHFGCCLPLLVIRTDAQYAAYLQYELGMVEGGDNFYDPEKGEGCQRWITFLIDFTEPIPCKNLEATFPKIIVKKVNKKLFSNCIKIQEKQPQLHCKGIETNSMTSSSSASKSNVQAERAGNLTQKAPQQKILAIGGSKKIWLLDEFDKLLKAEMEKKCWFVKSKLLIKHVKNDERLCNEIKVAAKKHANTKTLSSDSQGSNWSAEEDNLIYEAKDKLNWYADILELLIGRPQADIIERGIQLCHTPFHRLIFFKPLKECNELVVEFNKKLSHSNWSEVTRELRNHILCNFYKGDNKTWKYEEIDLLLRKYEELGNDWESIAEFFPERTPIGLQRFEHLLKIYKELIDESALKSITVKAVNKEKKNEDLVVNNDFRVICSTNDRQNSIEKANTTKTNYKQIGLKSLDISEQSNSTRNDCLNTDLVDISPSQIFLSKNTYSKSKVNIPVTNVINESFYGVNFVPVSMVNNDMQSVQIKKEQPDDFPAFELPNIYQNDNIFTPLKIEKDISALASSDIIKNASPVSSARLIHSNVKSNSSSMTSEVKKNQPLNQVILANKSLGPQAPVLMLNDIGSPFLILTPVTQNKLEDKNSTSDLHKHRKILPKGLNNVEKSFSVCDSIPFNNSVMPIYQFQTTKPSISTTVPSVTSVVSAKNSDTSARTATNSKNSFSQFQNANSIGSSTLPSVSSVISANHKILGRNVSNVATSLSSSSIHPSVQHTSSTKIPEVLVKTVASPIHPNPIKVDQVITDSNENIKRPKTSAERVREHRARKKLSQTAKASTSADELRMCPIISYNSQLQPSQQLQPVLKPVKRKQQQHINNYKRRKLSSKKKKKKTEKNERILSYNHIQDSSPDSDPLITDDCAPLQQFVPQKGKKNKKLWHSKDDNKLKELVNLYGTSDWDIIAKDLPPFSDLQCFHRWKTISKRLHEVVWTNEDDKQLINLVEKHGSNWNYISNQFSGKSKKHCRNRWLHLNPGINNRPWTSEEENIIITERKTEGSKWSKISKLLNNRSSNSIKNYWKTVLRNKYKKNMKNMYIKEEQCVISENEMLVLEEKLKKQIAQGNAPRLKVVLKKMDENSIMQYKKTLRQNRMPSKNFESKISLKIKFGNETTLLSTCDDIKNEKIDEDDLTNSSTCSMDTVISISSADTEILSLDDDECHMSSGDTSSSDTKIMEEDEKEYLAENQKNLDEFLKLEKSLKEQIAQGTASNPRVLIEKLDVETFGKINESSANVSTAKDNFAVMNHVINDPETWTEKDNNDLMHLVNTYGCKWNTIVKFFPGRNKFQCAKQYFYLRSNWSQNEEQKLIELVKARKIPKWDLIAKRLNKSQLQCRKRWLSYLERTKEQSEWTINEENIIIEAFKIHGSNWEKISELLPARSKSSIEKFWNETLHKKIESLDASLL